MKFTLYVACTSMLTVFINIDLTKTDCNTNESCSLAKQNKTKQNKTKQNKTKQNKTKQNKTKQQKN